MGGAIVAEQQNYMDLVMRFSTALAVTEAAYVEDKRHRG
jgi:hypothetical protein